MSTENQELKECFKQLQREMLDIVSLKQDIFTKRYKAEFGANKEPESEQNLKHQLELIREELFNSSFEETGKELIQKFKYNFARLREFMDAIDKEIGSMALFNTREDRYTDDPVADGFTDGGKLSDITSVQQLKHLLKNYDALVEGQHHLLT